MFEVENGVNVTERQLEQIIDLCYCRTWFFEYLALNNAKKISVEEYLREHFIRPRLSFVTMVLDERNNVAGFEMGLTSEEEEQLASNPALNVAYREYEGRAAMREYLNAYDKECRATDYNLYILSVRSDLQSAAYAEFDNKKVSDILLEECIRKARQFNCTRIMSSIKVSNSKSCRFFINKNKAKVVFEHDLTNTVFNDKVICFALDVMA